MKNLPLWDVEPSKFIVPLLHLEIGLVNKAWAVFHFFLRDKIDYISNSEMTMRTKLHNLKQELDIKQKDVATLKEQCSKIQQQQKQLSKDLTNIQKKIRTLQSNTTSLDVKLHQNLSSTKNDIGDIKNRSKETIKLVRTHIRDTNYDISSIKSDILCLNTDIKNKMKQ